MPQIDFARLLNCILNSFPWCVVVRIRGHTKNTYFMRGEGGLSPKIRRPRNTKKHEEIRINTKGGRGRGGRETAEIVNTYFWYGPLGVWTLGDILGYRF